MTATAIVNIQEVFDIAEGCSFESVGAVDADKLEINPEVRNMCAAGRCQAYGKNWMCPPHCGTLDEFATRIASFNRCVVVQTVGDLEDEFDFETMIETEKTHKTRFLHLADELRTRYGDNDSYYLLAAGTCTLCPACSCPDEPCRNPQRALVSMEAAGLLVSDVCVKADIPYNHGKNTIAYTSCVLV